MIFESTRSLIGIGTCVAALALGSAISADDKVERKAKPGDRQAKNLLTEDFEAGAERWSPTDPLAWKIEKTDGNSVYSQFTKRSKYDPPHRSPYNIALLKDVTVGDFELTARVRSTIPDYGHRDACVFFGYQDPAHFYYVHLGKKADDHANQIFIVNGAPRTKVSKTSTAGTNWTDDWHNVKIVRNAAEGKIAVYFDDMEKPVMTAEDKNFTWGQVGIGSFDDTTQWDDIKLQGQAVEPTSKKKAS